MLLQRISLYNTGRLHSEVPVLRTISLAALTFDLELGRRARSSGNIDRLARVQSGIFANNFHHLDAVLSALLRYDHCIRSCQLGVALKPVKVQLATVRVLYDKNVSFSTPLPHVTLGNTCDTPILKLWPVIPYPRSQPATKNEPIQHCE